MDGPSSSSTMKQYPTSSTSGAALARVLVSSGGRLNSTELINTPLTSSASAVHFRQKESPPGATTNQSSIQRTASIDFARGGSGGTINSTNDKYESNARSKCKIGPGQNVSASSLANSLKAVRSVTDLGLGPSPPETPPKRLFTEEELTDLFLWIDGIPFKSPKAKKGNIHRDFADGVLLAELIHHFAPKLVSLHNYSPMNGLRGKIDNWETINSKVLVKLGIPSLFASDVYDLANAKPGAIEDLLVSVREKLESYHVKGLSNPTPSSAARLPSEKVRNVIPMVNNNKKKKSKDVSALSSVTKISSGAASRKTSSDWSIPSSTTSSTSKNENLSSQQELETDMDHFEDVCSVYSKTKAESNGNITKLVHSVNYRGIRMVPEIQIDDLTTELSDAHEQINFLETKIRRMETLIELKDDRLEYLTREVHNLTLKLECHK